jgi:hypothetical protein
MHPSFSFSSTTPSVYQHRNMTSFPPALPLAHQRNPERPMSLLHLHDCQGLGCTKTLVYGTGILVEDRSVGRRHWVCSAECLYSLARREVKKGRGSASVMCAAPNGCLHQVDPAETTHPMLRSNGEVRHYCSQDCLGAETARWMDRHLRLVFDNALLRLTGAITEYSLRIWPLSFRKQVDEGIVDNSEGVKRYMKRTYEFLNHGVAEAITAAFTTTEFHEEEEEEEQQQKPPENKKMRKTGKEERQ